MPYGGMDEPGMPYGGMDEPGMPDGGMAEPGMPKCHGSMGESICHMEEWFGSGISY